MRKYSYITIGKMLEVLENAGCKLSKPTYMRLMHDCLFQMHKNQEGWFVTTKKEAILIIMLIMENYSIKPDPAKIAAYFVSFQ